MCYGSPGYLGAGKGLGSVIESKNSIYSNMHDASSKPTFWP